MKDEDIYNLPVNNLTENNCVLFMWVTFPKLVQGLKTIEKWGFNYKACAFTWVKKNKKANSFFVGLIVTGKRNPHKENTIIFSKIIYW